MALKSKNQYVKVASHEGLKGEVKKVVLLYSGGLDTSTMVKWIQEEYKAEVIALTIDIGQQTDDLEEIRQKALNLGAVKAIVVDAREEFAEEYIARAAAFRHLGKSTHDLESVHLFSSEEQFILFWPLYSSPVNDNNQ